MTEFDLIWTDEEKQEAEKESYNQALEDFMDELPYSAMVRMSTLKEIAERLNK